MPLVTEMRHSRVAAVAAAASLSVGGWPRETHFDEYTNIER